MATDSAGTASLRNRFARQLFDGLPARYDRLAEVLSFGQNRRWRKAMVDAVVNCSPASVLDVATGPAGVALEIAARTSAQVTGVDLTPEMLKAGAAKVARSLRPAGSTWRSPGPSSFPSPTQHSTHLPSPICF